MLLIKLNYKYVIDLLFKISFFCIEMNQIRNKILLQSIAKRVRELREEKNITQEIFYLDTKIHIGRIETARVNLTVSTLEAICAYLQIDLATFFNECGNWNRKKLEFICNEYF